MTFVIQNIKTGRAHEVKADTPSQALRALTKAPIRTEPGVLAAGTFAVCIPFNWR